MTVEHPVTVRGHGVERRMSGYLRPILLLAALIFAAATPSPALSQQGNKAATKIKLDPQELSRNKRVFSGSEIQVATMNQVKADCSGGLIPQVRFRIQPANGSVRTEEVDYIVSRASTNNRGHCNGKQVRALGLFYKSADGFVGDDKIAVEVDFRDGTVRRYNYTIEVR